MQSVNPQTTHFLSIDHQLPRSIPCRTFREVRVKCEQRITLRFWCRQTHHLRIFATSALDADVPCPTHPTTSVRRMSGYAGTEESDRTYEWVHPQSWRTKSRQLQEFGHTGASGRSRQTTLSQKLAAYSDSTQCRATKRCAHLFDKETHRSAATLKEFLF